MNKDDNIWSKIIDVIQIMDAKMSRIEVDMKAIRKDLRYHIKRTDTLESIVEPLQKDILKFKIIGGFVVALGIGLCSLLGWLINILLTHGKNIL